MSLNLIEGATDTLGVMRHAVCWLLWRQFLCFGAATMLFGASNRAGQPHKLESGETVRLLHVGVVDDTFVAEFCTEYSLRGSDREVLGSQADEVLASFRERATGSGLRSAHVWPTICRWQLRWAGWYPVIIGEESTAFTYDRTDDGEWSRRE